MMTENRRRIDTGTPFLAVEHPAGRTMGFLVQLPAYRGPLDLLLYLIEREELDITKVSLARVTGAYLEYIHVLEQLQVDQVADFLVVAAKLLVIKSEALLPRPPAPRPMIAACGFTRAACATPRQANGGASSCLTTAAPGAWSLWFRSPGPKASP